MQIRNASVARGRGYDLGSWLLVVVSSQGWVFELVMVDVEMEEEV